MFEVIMIKFNYFDTCTGNVHILPFRILNLRNEYSYI